MSLLVYGSLTPKQYAALREETDMRIEDENGMTYDDSPTTPEEPTTRDRSHRDQVHDRMIRQNDPTPEEPSNDWPGNGEIKIKADINRRLREYHAEIAKEKKAKGEHVLSAKETLDFLAGQ